MEIKVRFVLGFLMLSATVLGTVPQKTKDHLAKRCFVWTPSERCTALHKEDDERLIKKLTAKLTVSQAADKVMAEGKDAFARYNDPVTAIYRYNQVLILDPKRAEAWQGAADGFVKLEMDAQAIPLVKKAIELDPKRGDAYVTLAKAQWHLKSDEARKNYEKGLSLGGLADPELAKALSVK